MVKDQHLSVSEVAQAMELGETAIRSWIKHHEADSDGSGAAGKPLSVEQRRIRELETQVRQLRSDNDLLKQHRPSFPGNCGEVPPGSAVAEEGSAGYPGLPAPGGESYGLLAASAASGARAGYRGERTFEGDFYGQRKKLRQPSFMRGTGSA